MQFLQKGNGVSWRRRAGPSADQTLPNVRPRATAILTFAETFDRLFEKLDADCPVM